MCLCARALCCVASSSVGESLARGGFGCLSGGFGFRVPGGVGVCLCNTRALGKARVQVFRH